MRKSATARATVPMGVMLLVAIGACQSSNRSGARDQGATAGAQTPADTSAAKTGPPAPAPKGLSDSNIVAILDAANKADSSAGALALKKATRPDVKAFAKLMMSEHHALRQAGQQLAKQLNVAPKPPERDPLGGYLKNEMDALQKTAKGPEFDRTYIDHEVSIHQAVLDFANQARVTTQTPELRDLIQKAIPVIQKHLQQADSLQKQLTPAA